MCEGLGVSGGRIKAFLGLVLPVEDLEAVSQSVRTAVSEHTNILDVLLVV